MIITDVFTRSAPASRRAKIPFVGLFRLAKQRRDLSKLDTHMLADIGLTEAAAHREATRPFWDVPAHWKG